MLHLDKFEYATDAAAQIAWVISLSGNNIPDMTSNTEPSGVCSGDHIYSGGDYYFFFSTHGAAGDGSGGYLSDGTLPWHVGYEFPANITVSGYSIEPWSLDSFPQRSPISWTFEGWNEGTSEWDILDTQTNFTSWVVNVFSNFSLLNLVTRYKKFRFNITANGGNPYSGMAQIKINGIDLILSSESTIVKEGSYSLKIDALSSSLGKTIVKLFSPTWNLSGQTLIKIWVRSSRIGSNFKLGFHDSGGTTTEMTPNIAAANIWQLITLDVSAIADTDKDAIDSIVLTILNADAENLIYLDNLYADDGSGGDSLTKKVMLKRQGT